MDGGEETLRLGAEGADNSGEFGDAAADGIEASLQPHQSLSVAAHDGFDVRKLDPADVFRVAGDLAPFQRSVCQSSLQTRGFVKLLARREGRADSKSLGSAILVQVGGRVSVKTRHTVTVVLCKA